MPPLGYHRLASTVELRTARASREQSLIVVPSRCIDAASSCSAAAQAFGIIANLYTVRSATNWGVGDFTDLATLCDGLASIGARVRRREPAARAAQSRRRHQPVQPGQPAVPQSDLHRRRARSRASRNRARRARSIAIRSSRDELARAAKERARRVRARDGAEAPALAALAPSSAPARPAHRATAIGRVASSRGGALDSFAHVRRARWHIAATGESSGNWHDVAGGASRSATRARGARVSPSARRARRLPSLAAVRDRPPARRRAAHDARDAGLAIGLYQDLAIGTSPTAPTSGRFPGCSSAARASARRPTRTRAAGPELGTAADRSARAARDALRLLDPRSLRAGFRHAGALRIDHVLGLFRLFWIPEGASGTHGAYVRFPSDDLLGILALESVAPRRARRRRRSRHRAADVPPAMRALGHALVEGAVLRARERRRFKPRSSYPDALAGDGEHARHGDDRRLLGARATSSCTQGRPDRQRRERAAGTRQRDREKKQPIACVDGLLSPRRRRARTHGAVGAAQRRAARRRAPLPLPHAGRARRPLARRSRRRARAGERPRRRPRQVRRAGRAGSRRRSSSSRPIPMVAADAALRSGRRTSDQHDGTAAAQARRYRLQLNSGFTLDDARALVPYLARLGISHIYARPSCARARGARTATTSSIRRAANPELGGEDGPWQLSKAISDARAWGWCSTSCPITWASARRIRSGTTCSRTARVALRDAGSTSTGTPREPLKGRVLTPDTRRRARRKVIERGEITSRCAEGRLRARLLRQQLSARPGELAARPRASVSARAAANETRPPRPAELRAIRRRSWTPRGSFHAGPLRTPRRAQPQHLKRSRSSTRCSSGRAALRRASRRRPTGSRRGAKGRERISRAGRRAGVPARVLARRAATRSTTAASSTSTSSSACAWRTTTCSTRRTARVFELGGERRRRWAAHRSHRRAARSARYLERLQRRANARMAPERDDSFPIFVEKILARARAAARRLAGARHDRLRVPHDARGRLRRADGRGDRLGLRSSSASARPADRLRTKSRCGGRSHPARLARADVRALARAARRSRDAMPACAR